MDCFGAFPEIFFDSFEEEMRLEETEPMARFLDAHFSGFKQSQNPNTSIWPYYAMGEEILADSLFQIDSSFQFESSARLNGSDSDEFIRECDSAVERALQNKRKFRADEQHEICRNKVQRRVRKKEEERNGGLSTSSSGSEDDDSNDSEASAVTELKEKARSGRGVATGSQSLYAKRRRERINERLKILQNLVPNGTKVDISTMLEEAVQYVKFLQLQIKLLSSDELWMYAPLAYNGMNIGIDLMIP